MSEEYDLKKSADKVGQLYPILKDAEGNIIDGFHRKDARGNWREETLEHIDTHEKLIKARLISNKFRRQVSTVEVEEWINELADIASKEYGVEPGKISRWIADETGYKRDTVTRYLRPEYKDPSLATTPEGGFNPPSPVLSEAEAVLGPEKLHRLKEELKQDRFFIREVTREIIKPPLPNYKKLDVQEDPSQIENPPLRYLSVGLPFDLFNKLIRFMSERKLMREPAIIQLIETGLKEDPRMLLKEMDEEVVKKILKAKSKIPHEVISKLVELEDTEKQIKVLEHIEYFRLNEKDSIDYIDKVKLGLRIREKPDKVTTFPEKYIDNIEKTFYRIRGWGIPMILSMGKEKWDEALPYVQGIHDWTRFLLLTKPDKPIEKQPKEPILRVTQDPAKIVEAEFTEIETTPKEVQLNE